MLFSYIDVKELQLVLRAALSEVDVPCSDAQLEVLCRDTIRAALALNPQPIAVAAAAPASAPASAAPGASLHVDTNYEDERMDLETFEALMTRSPSALQCLAEPIDRWLTAPPVHVACAAQHSNLKAAHQRFEPALVTHTSLPLFTCLALHAHSTTSLCAERSHQLRSSVCGRQCRRFDGWTEVAIVRIDCRATSTSCCHRSNCWLADAREARAAPQPLKLYFQQQQPIKTVFCRWRTSSV